MLFHFIVDNCILDVLFLHVEDEAAIFTFILSFEQDLATFVERTGL